MNFDRIESIEELKTVVELATKFLVCGTLRADLPYEKVYQVRESNRRLGLGLIGCASWFLRHGYKYGANDHFREWLAVWRDVSDQTADSFTERLGISKCKGKRAVAPVGTLSILCDASSGIEPLFAVAYKRRYLKNGSEWFYQSVIDSNAQHMIERYGVDPDSIETALDLAPEYERRIAFQADVQDFVDQAISSTVNLPQWGSQYNNESIVNDFANTVAKYAHRLRGLTCYPDASRLGQPLSTIPYREAVKTLGQEFKEAVETHDVCSITGKGGVCGL